MLKLVSVLIFASTVCTLTLLSALAEEPRNIEIKIINPNQGGPAKEGSTIPSQPPETRPPSAQSSPDRTKLNEIYEHCMNELERPNVAQARYQQETLNYLAEVTQEVMDSGRRVDPKFFELAGQVIKGISTLNEADGRNKVRAAAAIQGVAVPPPPSPPPYVPPSNVIATH